MGARDDLSNHGQKLLGGPEDAKVEKVEQPIFTHRVSGSG